MSRFISLFWAWLERRHRLAVLRRLAKLDAQIAAARELYVALKVHEGRFQHTSQARELGDAAGKIKYLEKIRAHNLQHEDVL